MKTSIGVRRWFVGVGALLLVGGVAAGVARLGWGETQRRLLATWAKIVPAAADDDHDDDHDHEHEGTHAGEQGQKCAHDHGGKPCTAAHPAPAAAKPHADHDDDDDDHDHATAAKSGDDHQHDERAAIALSDAARDNVGIRLEKVALRSFQRTISVPAVLTLRPGRTETFVAAPLTGVVTRIWPLQGETVAADAPLFDLRLTHEEVVEAQGEFLRTSEELEVVRREIGRLENVAASGVIAGKTLLERKYEQQKLEAVFRSQRQRLLLHGLSAEQVDAIVSKHELLSAMTVHVPKPTAETKSTSERLVQVEELKVTQGQHVHAGDPLCVLADYSELFIQGKAFEQDLPWLEKAASAQLPVTAVVNTAGEKRERVEDLRIVYLAPRVDVESRAFTFYVALPNRLLGDRRTADGRRFSSWQFKPGQRVELLAPVERWEERIVLPEEAVVEDGAEAYVFEHNAGHFDRRAVRVEYRDQQSVVIANDGKLQPGRTVVVTGAYQVHLALKNKSAGPIDPHAGHNH